MADIVQGLWIGTRLSKMEQLCVSSFLAHGHEYHLYAYEEVEGVPPGTTLKDASGVLPRSMTFRYSEGGSYAGFSNFFRYKLLLDRGGWWVDLDVVCLAPFRFDTDYVLATEQDVAGREFVTSGIMRVPPQSELMKRAWQMCQSKNPSDLRWGETGPTLMHQLVLRSPLCRYLQDSNVFCPLPPFRWFEAIAPKLSTRLPDRAVALHLWHEMWRRAELDKDEDYAPNSLYERLKRQYLQAAAAPAIA